MLRTYGEWPDEADGIVRMTFFASELSETNLMSPSSPAAARREPEGEKETARAGREKRVSVVADVARSSAVETSLMSCQVYPETIQAGESAEMSAKTAAGRVAVLVRPSPHRDYRPHDKHEERNKILVLKILT